MKAQKKFRMTKRLALPMLGLLVLVQLLSQITFATAGSEYLTWAKKIAATVQKYAVDGNTGLFASEINIYSGEKNPIILVHHAGWYLPGLWMLYWEIGDASLLQTIQKHSDALWKYVRHPIGLPYYRFDTRTKTGKDSTVSHRIQYQLCALGNWASYMQSIDAALKYQVKKDTFGYRIILNSLDGENPNAYAGLVSPDYFGCLDLRIPYIKSMVTEEVKFMEIVRDDYNAHIKLGSGNNETGLWNGELQFSENNALKGKNIWTATTADDTYCGLIMSDIVKDKQLFDLVKSQTDLAIKYCYDEDKNHFMYSVDIRNGRVLNKNCRWHTEWEWVLTLFILSEYAGQQKYLDYANRSYEFLMDNIDNPGHWASGEGDDWNLQQVGFLCLFRYHQTGDKKYLKDAFRVADFIIEKRLTVDEEDVFVGTDAQMDLRDAGDTIAFFTCLSDPNYPIFSSRYFLFPVGIGTVSLPVYENSYVDRFYSEDNGNKIIAKITGRDKIVKDIFVMTLSGEVKKVLVNGKEWKWQFTKVAGHRYVHLPDVPLREEVTVEIFRKK